MQYWKKLNPDGTILRVESHSYPHVVPDATEITKEEFEKYIASLPVIEPEVRDLATEIDELKAIVDEIKNKKIG